ncbi:Crp/Fnr family transcriptional regulator [Porphyromonas sp. COT-290 OH3588]|uniref:Crp/Fnr family transcriptional regulator n=1 Tax=Porphyromonas sp. COT-290 OH3588 TaxID=1515617 RepID=UPI0005C717FD|nr:Crp/Fnr family transcriptional regulator [Porphyromonas sp. COT-290 OH3588]
MGAEECIDHPAAQLTALWTALKTNKERDKLKDNLHKAAYLYGDRIFTEGDPVEYLFYLHSGKVKMYREGVGGRSHITRLIRPGQFFGIRPFFANKHTQTTAVAYEQSVEIFKINVDAIKMLLDNNTQVCHYFLEALSLELELAEERTISLTQKHIRGRLAETLLMLIKHYGFEADGATLAINLSRGDLAAMSNMTTSNAIRTLSLFSNERIIALNGRKIRIINLDGLDRISQLG